MTDASSIYHKARSEVAGMLRLDLNALSGEDAIRLDVGTSLRVLMDNQSGRLLRGESLDARELLAASEALSRILPPLREPPAADRVDPRTYMWETYKAMRDRGALHGEGLDGLKLTVEKLRAELAAKDTRIGELETTLAGSVPLPPNAVKLSLRNDNASRDVKNFTDSVKNLTSATAPAAPPQPAPPPPAAAPAAPRTWDDTPGGQAWHAWRDAGGFVPDY
jgi:hypothetical protein